MGATKTASEEHRQAAVWTRRRMMSAAAAGSTAILAACGPLGREAGPPKVQPATVRYLHVDTGQQVWKDAFGQVFSRFEAKYTGVRLQVEPVATLGLAAEKAIATFVAGDYYDMVYGHYSTSQRTSRPTPFSLWMASWPRTARCRPAISTRRRQSA